MKNFKLILIGVTVLILSSVKIAAADNFSLNKLLGDMGASVGSMSNQFQSGVNGLRTGDYTGVASGLQNFAGNACGTAVSAVIAVASYEPPINTATLFGGLMGFTKLGVGIIGDVRSGITGLSGDLYGTGLKGMNSASSFAPKLNAAFSGSSFMAPLKLDKSYFPKSIN